MRSFKNSTARKSVPDKLVALNRKFGLQGNAVLDGLAEPVRVNRNWVDVHQIAVPSDLPNYIAQNFGYTIALNGNAAYLHDSGIGNVDTFLRRDNLDGAKLMLATNFGGYTEKSIGLDFCKFYKGNQTNTNLANQIRLPLTVTLLGQISANTEKIWDRYGKKSVTLRIIDELYHHICSVMELHMLNEFALATETLGLTQSLIDALALPNDEDMDVKFIGKLTKEKAIFKSTRNRGLESNIVNFDCFKFVNLILTTTAVGSDKSIEKWLPNFLKQWTNEGNSAEELLIAFSYAAAGKYDNNSLINMEGTIGNERFIVSKERTDNCIYKCETPELNSNFSRAYRSFISTGLYKDGLAAVMNGRGPYEFDKNLVYQFYYDKTVAAQKFADYFIMMVNNQKNIKLVASIQSLNALYSTLTKIRPECRSLIMDSKDPVVMEYMVYKPKVSRNALPTGSTISSLKDIEKLQKAVSKTIVGTVVEQVKVELGGINGKAKITNMINSFMN